MRKNSTVIIKTVSKSISSHMNETKYSLNPKNRTHHQKFKVNCTVYIKSDLAAVTSSESYIIAALTAISKNKSVHTIGNKYEGGESGGWTAFSNLGIPIYVTIPPSMANKKVITAEYKKDLHFNTTISPFIHLSICIF